ncbi:hypothetical protein TSOC_009003, partial [Tetrabaena socialis]
MLKRIASLGGELVLERHVAQHGTRARLWPGPALEALRRRHEWLLGAIACCVCAVPRELFLPLGPRSRRLLFPDEKEEAEEEARAAAAAAPHSQEQYDEYGQPYEQQYDEYGQPYQYDYSTAEQYDYGDYYKDQEGQQQDPYGQQEDPLARYDFSGQKAAAAVELQWGGEQAGAYDNMDVTSDASAVAEARPGTALYTFNAETEGEVSVSAGDSVRVLHDLGEWFQVVAPSGQAGLVPASYVQLLDEQAQAGGEARGQRASQLAGVSSGALGGGALSSQPSFGGRAQASAGHVGLQPAYSYAGSQGQPGAPGGANAEYYAYQYENPEYDANNGNGAYGSYYGDYTQYGGDQYGGGSYTDAAYGGMYGEEAPAADAGGRGGKKGGFGGFDDFGAVLAEVKTAAAAARQQQQQEQRQQTATLLDAASTSTSTTLPAAPAPDADPEPPAAAPSYGDAAYGADNTWSAQGGAQEAATAAAE